MNPRTVWSEPPEAFSMRVVADGFEDPWEVTYGPDGYLWITERTGKRVVRVNPADGARKLAVQIDEVQQKLAQDGLLGLALDPNFLDGSKFVYVVYTYDADPGPDELRRAKIRRYTFDPLLEALRDPVDVLTDLPHGPDHGASRIAIGPDGKLYVSRGDHGSNFLAYHCVPNRAQELPTAAEIAARDWSAYQGKILRINTDGSIPADNPVFNGVRSHIFSYGHRNPQGLAFGPDGNLYSAEHGQDTDDEVNRIEAGGNYGWPLIAGYQDDNYYVYANWSASSPTPCEELTYGREIPDTVPVTRESDVDLPDFQPPLATFFTVPTSYDQRALGNATAALTGLDVYASPAIPGWNPSLLVASMVSGVIYRIPLGVDGQPGEPLTYFKAQDRYRDVAISPDGTKIYAVTTVFGRTLTDAGEMIPTLAHPGSLLEFTYAGPRDAAALPRAGRARGDRVTQATGNRTAAATGAVRAPLSGTGTPRTPGARGIYNWVHSTADAERSYPFYRDVFGIELAHSMFAGPPAPGAAPPRILPAAEARSDPLVWKLTNTAGSSYRTVFMEAPNTPFGLELSEFFDIDRDDRAPNAWDPGAPILIFAVRDLDTITSRLMASAAPIVTLGGAALSTPTGRAILVRDPDGSLVLARQASRAEIERAAEPGDVIGTSIALSVANTETALGFYRDLLGFESGEPRRAGADELGLYGLENGTLMQTATAIPGASFALLLNEFELPAGAADPPEPYRWKLEDVGSPQFQLEVAGLDALLERTRAAGYRFLSVDGEPIHRTFGRFVFAIDSDGALVEFVEPAAGGGSP